MKLLFYWNLWREAKNVEKNVCLVFCSFLRFVVTIDSFLISSFMTLLSFKKENKRRTFYAKFVLRKIEQKKWMKEVLATTCRQFMFIISIENERVGESCVITTKEWEGMHNSGKSKDFPPFSVLRNLWEILDWSSSSSQNWKSFLYFLASRRLDCLAKTCLYVHNWWK